jgi:hypothetical protein
MNTDAAGGTTTLAASSLWRMLFGPENGTSETCPTTGNQ